MCVDMVPDPFYWSVRDGSDNRTEGLRWRKGCRNVRAFSGTARNHKIPNFEVAMGIIREATVVQRTDSVVVKRNVLRRRITS
jgi:hypothetical protein